MTIGEPYPTNPRQISRKRHRRLADTLSRLGDISGIVHNLETDQIIGGNQRVSVFQDGAVELVEQFEEPDEQGTVGLGFVIWQGKPYAYRQVRWDEATAREANIEANLGGGTWDFDMLANWDAGELMDFGFDEDMLKDWQKNSFDLGEMLGSENGQGEPPETPPQVDKAEELRQKFGVELGQMWQLGEHRLICGDCTDRAVVERVMVGRKAEVILTDPPYDGQLGGAGFNKTPDVKMRVNRMQDSIQHLYTFNPSDIFPICEMNTVSPSSWFFFCNKKLVPSYINYALSSGRKFDLLLWHKPNFLPMAGSHYFPDTEYLVKIRDVGTTFNNGISKEIVNYGTYWVIQSQKGKNKEAEHPTIKPIKIICDQISICSNKDGIVFDPFLGSGTTLIACENLSRRCRAIEIDPGYVAVTLQRWADHTGKQPQLLNTS
jgi:DNA modification methylase